MFIAVRKRLVPIIQHARLLFVEMTILCFLAAVVISGTPLTPMMLFAWGIWCAHVIALTLLNEYYDNDTDPVLGLDTPVIVSKDILLVSIALSVIGVVAAMFIGGSFVVLSVLVTLISWIYSAPPLRWKRYPFHALLLNGAIGILTFVAASGGILRDWRVAVLGSILSAGILMLYAILGQLHQVESDRKQGTQSFVSLVGKKRSLYVVLACAASLCLGIGSTLSLLAVPLLFRGAFFAWFLLFCAGVLWILRSPITNAALHRNVSLVVKVTVRLGILGCLIALS